MIPFRSLAFAAFSLISLAAQAAQSPPLRAGAHSVNIDPLQFPVRVNAMFTERSADKVVDSLEAKALALADDTSTIVLCVVDTCMIPRSLIDDAKAQASAACGVPVHRMLVSATHTHSAPSAMGCLGSRLDPAYAASLPARIAAAITGAVSRLEPARIGWAQADDWEHTYNRRWIRRPDRMIEDPFGNKNVRAHMHPGYESPDAVGPSGPVDPQLSVIALQRLDGSPLAVFANYSMHYYESALLSSDYYGKFARQMKQRLNGDDRFVAIMSQGTSGDLMWMNYGAPKNQIGYEAYASEMATRVETMIRHLSWRPSAPLRMVEATREFAYRAPDSTRLAWAQGMVKQLGTNLPQKLPEIYALESIYLHERPHTELKLQAIGIGDLGIAAIPNEVYAITGLKIKQRSPFPSTFNIELANGAEGYIPPPEQHKLGGYTTWPARTAGLETNAEPRIVEALIGLLHEARASKPRAAQPTRGEYAKAVLRQHPRAYWRLEDITTPQVRDETGRTAAVVEDGVAVYLPGIDSRVGHNPAELPTPNPFSGPTINRAMHLAGGRLRADLTLGAAHSVEFWFWNGLPTDAREETGWLLSLQAEGADVGELKLGITGTGHANAMGRLIARWHDGSTTHTAVGTAPLRFRAWHHVLLSREGTSLRVHLDGDEIPDILQQIPRGPKSARYTLWMGGARDGSNGLEGKLDEIAVYNKALASSVYVDLHRLSGIKAPTPAAAAVHP